MVIFAVPIALIGLVALGAWLMAGQAIRRRRPDPPVSPADYGLPFEQVAFRARDGLRLGGWLTGTGRGRPTVIFCAGLFGSMDGDTHFLPAFVAAGFDVLQFDWRAHGVSEGERATFGVHEASDLLGALDFLDAREVEQIGLLGFSMGGAVALRVAAVDSRVACVVCDGGFVHPEHAIEGFFREKLGRPLRPLARLVQHLIELRLGLNLGEASPLSYVGRIAPRPVLFIYGERDPFVPLADQEAVLAACGEPKTVWRVEGAGHREAHKREPEAYRQRVIEFFRACLK